MIYFPRGSRFARFCRRDRRFLMEVESEGGCHWVHCNNSGSMLGLLRKDARVLISPAQRARRRLPYTLELIELDGIWVGVSTTRYHIDFQW